MSVFGLTGILPAIITPFEIDGDVNFEYLRNIVGFQKEAGVSGFFVCGSAGEGPLMSIDERMKVVDVVAEELKNRLPMIVHVGTTNTKETIQLAIHAERVGAIAVGAVTPYYFQPDLEGLIKHYEMIAEAVRIPVLVYNIPSRTGFNVNPSIMKKLFSIENVIGVKDSSTDLIQIREIIETADKPVIVVNGSDNLLLAATMMGVKVHISALANVVPEILVDLFKTASNGDYQKGMKLQKQVNTIKRILKNQPIASMKKAMDLRNLRAGLPRRPLRPLRNDEESDLRENLKSLDLFW